MPDASEATPCGWGPYQTRRPTTGQLTTWFRDPGYGLAVIAGRVSGHLEIIDCDHAAIADVFRQLADEAFPDLLDRCPRCIH